MNNIHGTFIPVYKPTSFSRCAQKQHHANGIISTTSKNNITYHFSEQAEVPQSRVSRRAAKTASKKHIPANVRQNFHTHKGTETSEMVLCQQHGRWNSTQSGTRCEVNASASCFHFFFFFEVGYSSTFVGFHFDELQANVLLKVKVVS